MKIKHKRDISEMRLWQRLNSEVLFTSKWLNVRRDVCRLPSGSVIDDYFVIEIPDGVTIVAITRDMEIVLVRQYKHGIGQVVLELPAGNVDPDEDPNVAINRELREETGYTASNIEYVTTIISKPARMTARTLVYFATGAVLYGYPEESDQEKIETVLVPLEELPLLIAHGMIITETSLAALLTTWDRLTSKYRK